VTPLKREEAMIKIVEDVGAPALVVAADIATLEMAPDWNEYISYILTGVGYVTAFMDIRTGGEFLKNVGIASLPLTARHIYNRVKGAPTSRRATAGAGRMALRPTPVSSISRSYNPEFEKVSPYAG
jgi:hypothetical protein